MMTIEKTELTETTNKIEEAQKTEEQKKQQKQQKKQKANQGEALLQEFQQAAQERIDELRYLEQQAKDREADLQETCIRLADATNSILDKMDNLQRHIRESFTNLKTVADSVTTASKQVGNDLQTSQSRVRFSVKASSIAILITVLCLIISITTGIHYTHKVSIAKAAFNDLMNQISGTPVMMHKDGRNYVRIKEDSGVDMNGPDGTVGRFAEIDAM